MTEQLDIPETRDGNEDLRTLLALCNELAEAKAEAVTLEGQLKAKKQRIEDLSEQHIPRLMEALGLSEIKTRQGDKIEIKEQTFANVSKDRMAAAVEWLQSKNMAGIVKTAYSIDAWEVANARARGITVQETNTIHPSTLKAFVAERLAVDQDFPKAIFGVSQRTVAVVSN